MAAGGDEAGLHGLEHAAALLLVVGAAGETATLLNQYFREYTGEVPAENLNFASWATSGAPSDPNVQYMGQLDTERENGQQNENLDGSYTVTADNTAVQ